MSYPTALSTPVRKNPQGFSLVEVLIVIAIIAILMTGGAIGMKHIVAGKNTSTAVSVCESLFSEARGIAISKRTNARLMIDVNDPGNDNYLRRIVIAHQFIDPNTGVIDPNRWVLDGRGYTMPSGTFYSRDFSKLSPSGNIPEENMVLTDDGAPAKNFTSYTGDYAYYELNSEGILLDPGSSFVIGAGVRPKNAGQPKTTKSAEKDFGGFVIWRNGRTSVFRSPKHIEDQTGTNLPAPGQPF